MAAHTRNIRLGTAIITLPMENPLRVAEDAAVLDLLANGRLEVGFGSGGTPTSFLPFGLTFEARSAVFAEHLHVIQSAWGGIRSPIPTIIFTRPHHSLTSGCGLRPSRWKEPYARHRPDTV